MWITDLSDVNNGKSLSPMEVIHTNPHQKSAFHNSMSVIPVVDNSSAKLCKNHVTMWITDLSDVNNGKSLSPMEVIHTNPHQKSAFHNSMSVIPVVDNSSAKLCKNHVTMWVT